MKGINWRAKLSSRKLWAAVAGFVTAVAAVLGADDMTAQQIAAVISAIGVLVAYIIGETCVDVARGSGGSDADGGK